MRRKSLFATFALAISLLATGCGAGDKSNNLELIYFGKPKEEQTENINYKYQLPKRANEEPEDQYYYLENYGDQGVVLDAVIKNNDRLSFLDIVLYSASTGKRYVYSAGAGDYIVEASTERSDDVWTTRLRFQWIGWDIYGKESDKCFFDTYLEIEEINFLTLNGAVTRTNIANSNIKRVNVHVVEGRDEYHTWSDWEYTDATCDEYGTRSRHCTVCGRESKMEDYAKPPLGHDCDGWTFENKIQGRLQQGDIVRSTSPCRRCQKTIENTLPNIESHMALIIPSDISSIGDQAFAGASGLTSITIPSTVTSIGYSAFASCYSLQSVTFESAVPPQIGSDVFSGTWDSEYFRIFVPCTSADAYENVSAEYWHEYAVRRIVKHLVIDLQLVSEATCTAGSEKTGQCSICHQQVTLTYPSLGHIYGEWTERVRETPCGQVVEGVRECTVCHELDIENHSGNINHDWVLNLEDGIVTTNRDSLAYKECQKCGTRESRRWINEFSYDDQVKTLVIPNSVKNIGPDTFYDFQWLTSVTIPNGVTTIDRAAFCGCRNLTNVVLPESLTYLGDDAFSSCENLESVTFQSEVPPEIGFNVFLVNWDRPGFIIYVPCNSGDAYKAIEEDTWHANAVYHIVPHLFGKWTVSKTPVSCGEPGEEQRVCSKCGFKETREVLMDHTWGETQTISAEGKTTYKKQICSVDGSVRLALHVTDGTLASGSSFDPNAPSGFGRLYRNGESFSWTFDYDSDAYGILYQRALKDNWSWNSNKSYFHVNDSAVTDVGNFNVTVNGEEVDKSSLKNISYEEMTKGGENSASLGQDLSPIGMCKIGEVVLEKGTNTIVYERLADTCLYFSDLVLVVKDFSHTHNPSSTWEHNEAKHWHTCLDADCPVRNAKINAATHTWDDGEVIVEPTEEATGVKQFTCTVCGYKRTETMPRLGRYDWDSEAIKENLTTVTSEVDFGDGIKGYKSNGLELTLNFSSHKTKTSTLKLLISVKFTNRYNTGFWYQSNAVKTIITLNNVDLVPPSTDINFDDLGCNIESSAKDNGAVLTVPVWIDIAQLNVVEGNNTLVIKKANNTYNYFVCGAIIE